MANTIDQTLTDSWVKIAEDTEDFMLSVHGDYGVALAYQVTDVAPTSQGHVLKPIPYGAQGYERLGLTPPGFVYARSVTPAFTVRVGLTVWTS